jgi:hypothetical protein
MKKILYFILLVSCFSCGTKETPVPPVAPVTTVSITSVTLFEGNDRTNFPFKVVLSAATDKDVTVSYATGDLSAFAGVDYIARTGTVTIPARSTETTINIVVLGDTIKQPDKQFSLTISNSINASIVSDKGFGTIRNDDTYIYVPSDGYITPVAYTGYSNLWNDEFSGTSIDNTIWGYDIGGSGWGNNELQYYTNSSNNSRVANGNLIIEARVESVGGRSYTSARMLSKGKKDCTFGRVDIRAKLPKGQGIWPALWMLGSNFDQVGWPACGEIDIMEALGHQPNITHASTHCGTSAVHVDKSTAFTLPTGDLSEKFHVYSLVWSQDNLQILIDDTSYFTNNAQQTGSSYAFNQPFFMILNLAVGGDWPGAPNASTVFPQQMIVDYVRVFKKL